MRLLVLTFLSFSNILQAYPFSPFFSLHINYTFIFINCHYLFFVSFHYKKYIINLFFLVRLKLVIFMKKKNLIILVIIIIFLIVGGICYYFFFQPKNNDKNSYDATKTSANKSEER